MHMDKAQTTLRKSLNCEVLKCVGINKIILQPVLHTVYIISIKLTKYVDLNAIKVIKSDFL